MEGIVSRFVVTRRDGEKVKLRIQELNKSHKDIIIDFMLEGYIREESFDRCAGIPNSKDAIEEKKALMEHCIDEGICPALVCCIDNGDALDIVACNAFYTARADDKEMDFIDQFTVPEVKKFFNIISVLHEFYECHSQLNVDFYLGGIGLYVKPSYRGCNIATELLKARQSVLQRHNIPLTVAWFSGSHRWDLKRQLSRPDTNKWPKYRTKS